MRHADPGSEEVAAERRAFKLATVDTWGGGRCSAGGVRAAPARPERPTTGPSPMRLPKRAIPAGVRLRRMPAATALTLLPLPLRLRLPRCLVLAAAAAAATAAKLFPSEKVVVTGVMLSLCDRRRYAGRSSCQAWYSESSGKSHSFRKSMNVYGCATSAKDWCRGPCEAGSSQA